MSTDAYVFAENHAEIGADLFFVFHGTGGNELQFVTLASAMVPTARVISPRGDVSEGGALRFFRRTGEGVYDMADLARGTMQMAAFVGAHKARLKPKRTIGFGYSNGANILASVMFRDGTLFDSVVLAHPLIPFQPEPQPGLLDRKILITAGERDPICPPQLTRALEDYFKQQGAGVQTLWHEGGHDLRNTEIAAATAALTGASP
jgi:phospholipase/carboxylesterase